MRSTKVTNWEGSVFPEELFHFYSMNRSRISEMASLDRNQMECHGLDKSVKSLSGHVTLGLKTAVSFKKKAIVTCEPLHLRVNGEHNPASCRC